MLEIIGLIIGLAAIAYGGYRVWQKKKNKSQGGAPAARTADRNRRRGNL